MELANLKTLDISKPHLFGLPGQLLFNRISHPEYYVRMCSWKKIKGHCLWLRPATGLSGISDEGDAY